MKKLVCLLMPLSLIACSSPNDNAADLASTVCEQVKDGNFDLADIANRSAYESSKSLYDFNKNLFKKHSESLDCTITSVDSNDDQTIFRVNFKSADALKVAMVDDELRVIDEYLLSKDIPSF
ncbi:hypothetical protein [Shewanella halifaxensis]|uniref:hypothetical protein n=1 Tax=Shewanella halifaxensis TaxID=271098 RepID=UPI000D599ABE|nr:hypothetical protein [Shewanella halifaxensis]